LNRFVWDLRHESLPGVPEVYIEGSFRGHRAIPGTYTLRLKYGSVMEEVQGRILPNPLIPTTAEEFREYHSFMSQAGETYRQMTRRTNQFYELQGRLKNLIGYLKKTEHKEVTQKAEETYQKLKAWDAVMAQRLSKAYDDVENFVNGFTAEYLTAMNHGDSGIPRINEGTRQGIGALYLNE